MVSPGAVRPPLSDATDYSFISNYSFVIECLRFKIQRINDHCVVIAQVKSRFAVRSATVSGGSLDQTSWRDIYANTPDPSRSSASTVTDHSPVPTTSPSMLAATSRDDKPAPLPWTRSETRSSFPLVQNSRDNLLRHSSFFCTKMSWFNAHCRLTERSIVKPVSMQSVPPHANVLVPVTVGADAGPIQ